MEAKAMCGDPAEEPQRALRVAIIGAGGVGLGIGSCLISAGAEVLFLVRGTEAARALRTHGLHRGGVFGTAFLPPERFEVAPQISALETWGPDYVLVCTKTTACEEVANALAATFGRAKGDGETMPRIVLCLNGWGNAEQFAERLPRERIFNARVITGFRRDAAWRVEITVHAEAIHIGSLYGAPAAHVEPLCRAIAEGGIPCAPSATIDKDLLAKLLYNCALNPLAALRGVPYGAIGEDPGSRAILEAVVVEIFAVLAASGLETHWQNADDYLAFFFETLLPPTRAHESSMLQDLRAKRRTEIDALCGAIVHLGVSRGCETPVNAALARLIRAIEPGR